MTEANDHEFPRGDWRPVKKPGSETERARRAGRSLHAQEVHDEHSPDPKIRGKGIFGLNAARGKFRHPSRSRRRSRSRT